MKLSTASDSFSNIPTTGRQFTMTASAKAFQIIASGVYQYKIAAIVREVCTNALDGHKAADKTDVPFTVTLPNELRPYFTVQDYGVGLSQDDMFDVYCNVFASTKADSNDFIGALGLGCKSPFSYVDSFNVTSTHNGTKTEYMASLDAGIPRMDIIQQVQTSETNGVTVKIPVKSEDFGAFAKEAHFWLSFYDVRPIIIGGGNHQFAVTPEHLQECREKGFVFVSANEIGCHSNVVGDPRYYTRTLFVMGSVPYRIEHQHVGLTVDRSDVRTALKTIGSSGFLLIDTPMGAVDVAASRESLSEDKATSTFIKQHFSNTLVNLQKQFNERMEVAKSIKDKIAVLMSMGLTVSDLPASGKNFKSMTKFRKIPNANRNLSDWMLFSNVQMQMFGRDTVRILVKDHQRNYVRKWVNAGNCQVVLNHNPSQLRKDRIQKLFGDTNVEFLSWADVVESNKIDRTKTTVTTSDGSKITIERGSLEIKACVLDGLGAWSGQKAVDLGDGRVYYRFNRGFGKGKYDFYLDDRYVNLTDVKRILVDNNVVLVAETTANKAKLDKCQVPYFNDLLKYVADKMFAENQGNIRMASEFFEEFSGYDSMCVRLRNYMGLGLVDNGIVEAYRQYSDQSVDVVGFGLISTYIKMNHEDYPVGSLVGDDVMRLGKNQRQEVINGVLESYPMLGYVHDWGLKDREVQDYIKIVKASKKS